MIFCHACLGLYATRVHHSSAYIKRLDLSFAPTRLYLSLTTYSCVYFRMDPEGPAIKSWLAKQAWAVLSRSVSFPAATSALNTWTQSPRRRESHGRSRSSRALPWRNFRPKHTKRIFILFSEQLARAFWAELSLEDLTAALREGGATAQTAPEVSANNPATMLLSLGTILGVLFHVARSSGRAAAFKTGLPVFYRFFCSYRRLPLTPPPRPPLR